MLAKIHDNSAEVVGQDGILRAGWQPALYERFASFGRRVINPPQVANLSHKPASVTSLAN